MDTIVGNKERLIPKSAISRGYENKRLICYALYRVQVCIAMNRDIFPTGVCFYIVTEVFKNVVGVQMEPEALALSIPEILGNS